MHAAGNVVQNDVSKVQTSKIESLPISFVTTRLPLPRRFTRKLPLASCDLGLCKNYGRYVKSAGLSTGCEISRIRPPKGSDTSKHMRLLPSAQKLCACARLPQANTLVKLLDNLNLHHFLSVSTP